MKPRLLDLFCGAGGCARGYQRAGFHVVGVDSKAQPRYAGDEFLLADAMTFPLDGFDAIHASPPCQRFSRARMCGTKKEGPLPPDLVGATRERLQAAGVPWVIENVVGAPLDGVTLCGSMFGLKVRRHRVFESSVLLLGPECRHAEQGRPIGVYHTMGDQVQGRSSLTGKWVLGGRTAETVEEAREAMGIDWMTWPELTQAIPPAYTEHVGRALLAAVEAVR